MLESGSGPGGRRFKSFRPDQFFSAGKTNNRRRWKKFCEQKNKTGTALPYAAYRIQLYNILYTPARIRRRSCCFAEEMFRLSPSLGSNLNVIFTLNLVDDPTIYSVSTTFNVAGPSTITVQTFPATSVVINSGPQMQLGSPPSSLGILFEATAVQPPGGYSSSNFEWIQLITNDSTVFTIPSGSCTASTGTGLDNTYPYEAIVSGSPGEAYDSPFVGLPATATNAAWSFGATMFLMWNPNTRGSIPVPLGYIPWSVTSDAKPNSGATYGWSVQTGAVINPSSTTFGAFTESSTFPTWSTRVVNGPINCHVSCGFEVGDKKLRRVRH
jgi:hypothetical protein